MLVRDAMRALPKTCSPATNIAEVTELLWAGGCGALPVVDSKGTVQGIITDRDICVALGTRNRRASELVAREVMSKDVAICRGADEIHDALITLRDRQIRRLPVLDQTGKIEGILCVSDLILGARHNDGSRPPLSYEDVMNTLKGIHWRESMERTPVTAG